MVRILHAADLHLGGPVAAPDEQVAALAQRAREEGLRRLVDLARDQEVDLVLLAGDVFHTPRPPLGAQLALQGACAAWVEAGARVFIAPGNHDPFIPGSVWETWEPPQGVCVFGPEPAGLELGELGLWLAGAGHHSDHVDRDLAAALPPPPAGLTGLALLHADLPSSRRDDVHHPYAPTRLEILQAAPFAYWALGHWHKPQELCSRPRVIMAGTHQGAHLDEDGPRGAWLVEIEGGAVESRLVPLAPLGFLDLVLSGLEDVADPGRLVALVREGLAGRDWGQDYALCLRLRLEGPSPLWRDLRGEQAGEGGRALARALDLAGLVLDVSGLVPPLDPEELARRPDVLGRMLGLVERLARGDEELLAELEAELAGDLHPLLRELQPAERRRLLGDLAGPVRSLALRHLWQGPGEGA